MDVVQLEELREGLDGARYPVRQDKQRLWQISGSHHGCMTKHEETLPQIYTQRR